MRTPEGASDAGSTAETRSPSSTSARSLSTSPAATSTRRPAITTSGSAEGIGGAYSRPPPSGGCYRPSTGTRSGPCGRYLKGGTTQAPCLLVAAAALVVLASLVAAAQPAAATTPTWFDLPATDSFPQGVAAGPDGTTWVANRFASEIERVRPGGSARPDRFGFGRRPLRDREGSRRGDVVHRAQRESHRAAHRRGRPHRILPQRPVQADRHHGRSRRCPVVHAARGECDRSSHPRRGAHRVADPHAAGGAAGHHDRPRRRGLVHPDDGERDRPDHHRRRR